MPSPTQRSLQYLKDEGYEVEVVEKWNPWAKVRHDLFGIADLLAVRPGETLAVQTTTYFHMKERQKKILASANKSVLLLAGWKIRIHGWKKPTKKIRTWTLGSIDIDA